MMEFKTLVELIANWAEERDLISPLNANRQMLKVIEEIGELSAGLARNNEEAIKDGIGDSFVTLIILSYQLGLHPKECLESAWNEIKDRTGNTENGVFIKYSSS